MNLAPATVAARLQSWASFFENESFMDAAARLDVADALDAVLVLHPENVTPDPVPFADGPLIDGEWGLDDLTHAARASRDAKLGAMSEHVSNLAQSYMARQAARAGV